MSISSLVYPRNPDKPHLDRLMKKVSTAAKFLKTALFEVRQLLSVETDTKRLCRSSRTIMIVRTKSLRSNVSSFFCKTSCV